MDLMGVDPATGKQGCLSSLVHAWGKVLLIAFLALYRHLIILEVGRPLCHTVGGLVVVLLEEAMVTTLSGSKDQFVGEIK